MPKAEMREADFLLRDAFGLSTYEARVYVGLLRRRMTAKEASTVASVPMPRIYDTLQKLSGKGFVKRTASGYVSVEPAVALQTRMKRFDATYSEEKSLRENAKRRILAELQPRFDRMAAETPEPVLLAGLDSIGGAFMETLQGPGDAIILVRKAMKAKAAFIGLIGSLASGRKRIRIVLPVGTKLSDDDARFAKEYALRIRYAEPSILDVMVAGDRDVILGVPTEATDEPFAAMAVWVRNTDFARSVRSSLEETWRRGRGN